jgi:serine/threonine-protein kinase HipA
MGVLHCQGSGAGEVYSFKYDRGWLERPEAFAFDPDLVLAAGHQYPAPDRTSFGIFLDSPPDRWGRVLMQRRENMRARREKRKPRALTQWDFLLGVHDHTRLGALRFRPLIGGDFIDSDTQLAAPPISTR